MNLRWPLTDLEELDADDSEHELEENGDKHDVVNGLDSDDDALHHMLQRKGQPPDTWEPMHLIISSVIQLDYLR